MVSQVGDGEEEHTVPYASLKSTHVVANKRTTPQKGSSCIVSAVHELSSNRVASSSII